MEEAHLREVKIEINNFPENPNLYKVQKSGKTNVDIGSTSNFNFMSTHDQDIISTHWMDMENINFLGKSFRWRKIHPKVNNYVKTIFTVSKEDKEDLEKLDFPPNYNEVIE